MRRAFVPAAVAALAVAACPASAVGASAGGGAYTLAADGSPLDLRSVALGQVDRDLVLTVRARSRIDPAQLAAGKGRLCATLGGSGVCVERRDGRWALRRGARAVEGSVGRPRPGTLVVRVTPQALGLTPGALRWSVAATPAACADASAAQTGGATPSPATGGGVPTQPEQAAPCRSRAPRGEGTYAGRVWRAVVTGCTRSGAGQVSRGPSRKEVALTYDDGPSPYTRPLLATLDRLGVPATFYMIGQQVPGQGALLRRMLANGHELANHSWNHANLGGGGPGASSQLSRTSAAIRAVTGFTPCIFRPPYGSTGADLVARANALGMTSVIWSADPLDWRTPGAGAIVSRVLSQTGPGGIILGHDGGGNRSQSLAAAPQIIAGLRTRGYRFVTVSRLLGYPERITLRR